MELDTNPPQPAPIADAIRAALDGGAKAPDPWWQAGIDDALEPFGE